MQFYSTKHQAPKANLKTAVLQSLPPDNGLYMPESIDVLPASFWMNIENLSFQEISFEMAKCLLKGAISDEDLKAIIDDAINFDAPLLQLDEHLHVLELTHGPSLAFKDFGARFMSRLMSHLAKGDERELNILVATSGDTGGAVALGFYKTANIQVTILYPSGKVSNLQEKQLTTLGHNIRAIEVNGTFDDCQALVKQAFLDEGLNSRLKLSSANSINIARLIPQSFYYAWAYRQLKDKSRPIAICVPSGNFGNITAGLLAHQMGLPVQKFVAANNANQVFKNYYQSGNYQPQPSVTTLSNAMDVGSPSNFQRIMDLYHNDINMVRSQMAAYAYNDAQTIDAIKELHQKYDYVACPHTAVAYLGMQAFLADNPNYTGIFQSTAHPSKFIDIVEETLNQKVEIPAALQELMPRQKQATFMEVDYKSFKDFLVG